MDHCKILNFAGINFRGHKISRISRMEHCKILNFAG